MGEPDLRRLFDAIALGDTRQALHLLEMSPPLATTAIGVGATRAEAKAHFFETIEHYVYAGDTALHLAAAAYQSGVANALIAYGATARARNRRGAEPLHYAADGRPGSAYWNPSAQAATVSLLIRAGADPNARDASGVTPLHRAVRTRCAAAVGVLLDHGADAQAANGTGSTAMDLAVRTTGRGGTGSDQARIEQQKIVRLLTARARTRAR